MNKKLLVRSRRHGPSITMKQIRTHVADAQTHLLMKCVSANQKKGIR